MKEPERVPGPGVSGSKPDIPAIKARYEAATEGPWVLAPEPGCIANSYLTKLIARVMPLDKLGGLRANTDFIVHARTDIPQLVTALEEAQGKLDRERLAALEHEQWVEWSRAIADVEAITATRLARWEKMWVPYAELSEEQKDQDRVWADRILKGE